MDTLIAVLENHTTPLGLLAGLLTIMQYFGGLSTCYYVQMDENLRIPNSVFIGNFVVTSITAVYANLIEDFLLLAVNITYAALDAGCILIYWYHSRNRWRDTYFPLFQSFCVISIFFGYKEFEDEVDKLLFRYGVALNVLTMFTLLHPTRELRQVIKDRTSPRIGMQVVLTTAMTYGLWLLYAIAIRDVWIFGQNLQWFTMCLLQLLLCKAFPQLTRRDYSVSTVSFLEQIN